MIPENWKLYEYSEAMPTWKGWYEDKNGTCTGFLAHDGKVVAFDAATDSVTPIN